MNVSLNWLKDYLKIDQSTEEICKILTSIGLEVGGYEEFEAVKGGLKGLVIGKVLTCEEHPDSDHLHVTTVDLGTGANRVRCTQRRCRTKSSSSYCRYNPLQR